MNRLSRWMLGAGLALTVILISACGSQETNQNAEQPPASEETNGASTETAPEVNNNANPQLTPETSELSINTVQQGPGQVFFRIEQLPEGYSVSRMEFESPNYNAQATFEQAVQNGNNGTKGFYASSDQRNLGFIYDQSYSGQEGKVTLTLHNEAGDELTWYDDLTLQ